MVCQFAGQEYSEGALICSNGRELRCSGGGWAETGYECSALSLDGYMRHEDEDKKVFVANAIK